MKKNKEYIMYRILRLNRDKQNKKEKIMIRKAFKIYKFREIKKDQGFQPACKK